MVDHYIFGFGLVVTLLVGSGITTMIIANNRAIEEEGHASKVRQKGKPDDVTVSVSKGD